MIARSRAFGPEKIASSRAAIIAEPLDAPLAGVHPIL
jgi:hypothetical protein